MANLITPKQKKVIRSEYRIRLAALILLITSLLGAFLLAYVIPYYISISKKDLIVASQFQSVLSVENKENVGESISRIMTRTLDELRAAESFSKNNSVASENFTKIIQSKNSNIQITRLSWSAAKKGQGQFLVNGIAKNRDSLVTFINDLKSKGGFAKVESPVSDFAKEANIAFTINLKTEI